MKTKIIQHGGGYLAMKYDGFALWKEWKPISWTIHETIASAYKEIEIFSRCGKYK